MIIEKSIASLRKEIPILLEDPSNQLTCIAREFVYELHEELIPVDHRIESNEAKASQWLSHNDDYSRLQTKFPV